MIGRLRIAPEEEFHCLECECLLKLKKEIAKLKGCGNYRTTLGDYIKELMRGESLAIMQGLPAQLAIAEYDTKLHVKKKLLTDEFRHTSISIKFQDFHYSNSYSYLRAVEHCEELTLILDSHSFLTKDISIPLSFTSLRKLSLHNLN